MKLPGRCIDRVTRGLLAAEPVSHDNLFHTVPGLMDVTAALHDPALDVTGKCRTPSS